MRVCMVSVEYEPNNYGGLGRHTTDLARSLAAQGTQVHVVTHSPGGSVPDDEREGNLYVHRVQWPLAMDKMDWDCRVANWNCAYIAKVLDVVRDYQIDVVHAQDWSVCQTLVALKRLLATPTVSTIHMGAPEGSDPLLDYRHSQIAALIGASDALICCSHYMKAELERLYSCPAHLAVVPNGVFLDRFPFAEHLGDDVLFVGRLVPRKGVHELIRAFHRVQQSVHGDLIIVGGGSPSVEAELRALARELGIGARVRFEGPVENARLTQYMRHARVVAIPSLYEPLGIVALEAMASGVPVVAYDVGGLAEIIHDGLNGLKVPAGDVGRLAERLEFAWHHDLDGIRRRARQEVERAYTWQEVARQTARVYEGLLDA